MVDPALIKSYPQVIHSNFSNLGNPSYGVDKAL